jgi:ribosomal protein L44E
MSADDEYISKADLEREKEEKEAREHPCYHGHRYIEVSRSEKSFTWSSDNYDTQYDEYGNEKSSHLIGTTKYRTTKDIVSYRCERCGDTVEREENERDEEIGGTSNGYYRHGEWRSYD